MTHHIFDIKDCTIAVHVEPEIDYSPEDAFDDPEIARDVRAAAEHNVWAWCAVKVTVTWESLTGRAYLGGCSYDSEDAFRGDGYFADMIEEARSDLDAQARAHLLLAHEIRTVARMRGVTLA